MVARAYYNELDPFAAEWLRELIRAGLIAPGDVDDRSIADVQPGDLAGYTQCHFFAGIGVWSYALRCAGWADARPVWTGSCPCPPFSSAGKAKPCPRCGGARPVPHVGRTGFFVCCACGHEWLADPRHLWPELWRLIAECRPEHFFGEQVASADGRIWLATVRASLEILGYAVGAADTCAAGVGAPHVRQRLYFVADTDGCGRTPRSVHGRGETQEGRSGRTASGSSLSGDVGQPIGARLEGHPGDGDDGHEPGRLEAGTARPVAAAGDARVVGDPSSGGRGERGDAPRPGDGGHPERTGGTGFGGIADANGVGFWSDIRWHPCRDGKLRPVPLEPALFPLAPRTPGRVGLLRGAGNAIVAPLAQEFIQAYLEVRESAYTKVSY